MLKNPKARLGSILRTNELTINVDQDREEIAQQMVHYNLMIVPVVNQENIFLGVISSDTLVEVIEQEASEDIYRMAALSPIKDTYFETPFFKLFYQRGSILLILLVLQSFSSLILQIFQATLCGFLMFYITTLISTVVTRVAKRRRLLFRAWQREKLIILIEAFCSGVNF